MILFIIICVVVLSSLSYRRYRPMSGWGWFDRPMYFRHHRPMGPRPMGDPGMGHRPMGGPGMGHGPGGHRH